MAVLSAEERAALRRMVARLAEQKGVPVRWTKANIDAAMQAIENRWELAATKTAISNDIEAAAPGVFTVAQKRYLTTFWLLQKAGREEVQL